MRDKTIEMMHQATAQRSMMLLQQFGMLKARQDALDIVVRDSTFLQRVGWVFSVARFTSVVDHIELKLLQAAQKEVQEAAEAKKEANRKPLIHRIGQ